MSYTIVDDNGSIHIRGIIKTRLELDKLILKLAEIAAKMREAAQQTEKEPQHADH